MGRFGRNSESIRVEGKGPGKSPLAGRLRIQGSKNAALPILAASMLIPGKCVLRGCPDITDIECMCGLLESTGVSVDAYREEGGLRIAIDTRGVRENRLPEKYVSAMRSSVVMMGAMLGRIGEVRVNYPGGCVIGERPIDLHLYGLERLGAQIWIEGDHIHAYADELKGAVVDFPFSSVGATQNVVMAAATARGTTVIRNAAREPEVVELCNFLNAAGADIDMTGLCGAKGRIVVRGVELSKLHGADYGIIPDRIVAGTYMFAVLAAGGEVTFENVPAGQLGSVSDIISGMGAEISEDTSCGGLTVRASDRGRIRNLPYIETDVYPAFPTDLQSPLLVAACMAEGILKVKERIFSSRFRIVEELRRMGADIEADDDTAVVTGVRKLEGRSVTARELRGGAALVIAGLCAEGTTTVAGTEFISRGYQDIVGDLKGLGAMINCVE